MNFYKAVFFYNQFSFTEFISLIFYRLLGTNQRGVKRDTLKFFEERFKAKTKVMRTHGTSLVHFGVNNHELKINVRRFSSDVLVFTQVMVKKEFEPVLEVFRKYNFAPQYIVDGGANIGLSTLYLKSFYPDAQVVAVEPNETTFHVLDQNIQINRLKNVHPLKAGLWSANEVLEADNDSKGNEWGFSVQRAGNSPAKSNIVGRTISSIVQELSWSRIDYLKIDIEGAEAELFKSAEIYDSFLSTTHAISLEVHGKILEEKIKSILTEYGFQLHAFGELIFGFRKKLSA